jgi:diguanylate cyclase (GGDEF)-like protein
LDRAAPHIEPDCLSDVLEATRALLRVESAREATAVAVDLIHRLGGDVVSARGAPANTIPVDVSFGEGPPLLPFAPPDSVARMHLERYLPLFVEDAQRAVAWTRQAERLAEAAAVDPLTGLANRRMIGRRIGRLEPGELVVMIDLDLFKNLNDTLGHQAGDHVLRSFGRLLQSSVRERDRCGRYGGEEFVVTLGSGADGDAFIRRLRHAWEAQRPHPVTFSAGIAVCGDNPMAAVAAADDAMYQAKRDGRDRWAWSVR